MYHITNDNFTTMKKFYLTLCIAVITLGSLMAGPVSQQKAQQIGAKFLSTTSLGQRYSDIQLTLVNVATDNARGEADYMVFNVANGEGFVIVAADDRVKPILAYSTEGKYNPNDVAEGFAFTLSGFQDEIHYVREHNLTATPDSDHSSAATTSSADSVTTYSTMVCPRRMCVL